MPIHARLTSLQGFSTPPFRKLTPSLSIQPILGLALYFYAKIKGGRSSPLRKLIPPRAGYLLHEETRFRCNSGGDVRGRILSTEQSTWPGIIKYTFPCQHETKVVGGLATGFNNQFTTTRVQAPSATPDNWSALS